MSPDLADLLKVALSSLVTGFGAFLVWLARKAKEKREQPIVETNAVISITNDLQALAKDSVSAVRIEMAELRKQHDAERLEDRQALTGAREQLREMARKMEVRETEHVSLMERMKRRIAQLVQALTDNDIDVPAEDD